VFTVVEVLVLPLCLRACSDEVSCESVSYDDENKLCRLYNTSVYNVTKWMCEKETVEFYQLDSVRENKTDEALHTVSLLG
jgi:hypothetical protein